MLRIVMALVALSLFAGQADAQLFPNAFWNRSTTVSSDTCPGDVCPTGRGVLRPNVNVNVNTASPSLVEQHNFEHNGYWGGPQWTWPGDLQTHLATSHNVAPPAPQYAQSSYATAPQTVYVQRSGGSSGSAVRSGGSSGSIRTVCVDACGNVITSVGSTVSPQLQLQPQASGGVQQLAIGDRVAFRRSLLEAARNARKSGEITAVEFFMLSAASRNPATLDKMQAAIHEAAIEEGLATAQAIDWNSLIDFIEKLIPIIIKLIDLFG